MTWERARDTAGESGGGREDGATVSDGSLDIRGQMTRVRTSDVELQGGREAGGRTCERTEGAAARDLRAAR